MTDMKTLTRKQVRKIVESAARPRRRLNEGVYDTDPADLIKFADRWASLGEPVQSQVKQVLNLGVGARVNHRAIEHARTQISGYNEQLDQMLDEYLMDPEDY